MEAELLVIQPLSLRVIAKLKARFVTANQNLEAEGGKSKATAADKVSVAASAEGKFAQIKNQES